MHTQNLWKALISKLKTFSRLHSVILLGTLPLVLVPMFTKRVSNGEDVVECHKNR